MLQFRIFEEIVIQVSSGLVQLRSKEKVGEEPKKLVRKLRIHAIIERSTVNGPGERLTIWTQGCRKGCKGCFNPDTWAEQGGTLWDPVKLAQYVLEKNPEGLTLSGGDPLEQAEDLLEFLRALHNEKGELIGLEKGIICFTGYTREEVCADVKGEECLAYIDLLIDGRYVEAERYENGLAGSKNQRFYFLNVPRRGMDRIALEEVITDQEVEVHNTNEHGQFAVTGFPSFQRREFEKLGIRLVK